MSDNIERESYSAARIKALESLLIEKGIVTSGTSSFN